MREKEKDEKFREEDGALKKERCVRKEKMRDNKRRDVRKRRGCK